MKEQQEILTRAEAAEYFKVSLGTLDKSIKAGMPVLKVGPGRAIRIPIKSAIKWMKQGAKNDK